MNWMILITNMVLWPPNFWKVRMGTQKKQLSKKNYWPLRCGLNILTIGNAKMHNLVVLRSWSMIGIVWNQVQFVKTFIQHQTQTFVLRKPFWVIACDMIKPFTPIGLIKVRVGNWLQKRIWTIYKIKVSMLIIVMNIYLKLFKLGTKTKVWYKAHGYEHHPPNLFGIGMRGRC